MPGGIPVGTLAIGKPGAINAALLAAAVLALSDAKVAKRLDAWRARQTKAVAAAERLKPLLKPGSYHRNSRRRTARAHAGARRGTARPALPCLFAGKGFLRFRRGARRTCAAYEDETALGRFADAVDVITYEFENVPAEDRGLSAARKPVLPDPKVLETTQDRLIEKNFVAPRRSPPRPMRRCTARRNWPKPRRRSACPPC